MNFNGSVNPCPRRTSKSPIAEGYGPDMVVDWDELSFAEDTDEDDDQVEAYGNKALRIGSSHSQLQRNGRINTRS